VYGMRDQSDQWRNGLIRVASCGVGAEHARAPCGALQELAADTSHMNTEEKAEFEAYCRHAEQALRAAVVDGPSTRDTFVVLGDPDPLAPAAAAAAAAAAAEGSAPGETEWTQVRESEWSCCEAAGGIPESAREPSPVYPAARVRE
jgi:hypothetical protein